MNIDNNVIEKLYDMYICEWCNFRGYYIIDVMLCKSKNEQYNGEMYVCKEEFMSNEFRNVDFIMKLLNKYVEKDPEFRIKLKNQYMDMYHTMCIV